MWWSDWKRQKYFPAWFDTLSFIILRKRSTSIEKDWRLDDVSAKSKLYIVRRHCFTSMSLMFCLKLKYLFLSSLWIRILLHLICSPTLLASIGPATHHPSRHIIAYGPPSWLCIVESGSTARGQFDPINSPTLRSVVSGRYSNIRCRYFHFFNFDGVGTSSPVIGNSTRLKVFGRVTWWIRWPLSR